jgi:hypothetical protein
VTTAERVAARYASDVLTKEWLMGVRRGWLKVMDPPIGDWDDVHQAYKNIALFIKNLMDQVFYARRGPYTGTPTMTEGKKVLDLLGKLAGAADELKSRARHWQTVQEGKAPAGGGFRQEEGEHMLNLYRTDFPSASEFALEASPGKWRNASLTELMDKVLKLLREDAARIKDHDEAHPNDQYSPPNVYKEFDLHGMKVVIDDDSLLPSEINEYVKYLDEAYQRLKQKGFGKVWYGTVFVKCKNCGGTNQYGPELGVGGNYPIGPDVVNIFSRPSKFIVELMAHELGHRYWFKFMSPAQRGKFESLINIEPLKPLPPDPDRLIPESKGRAAKDLVDLSYDTLKRLLKDFGASRLGWWPAIIKKFEDAMTRAAYQATDDLITAMQKPGSWINTPEIRQLHEDALKASGEVSHTFSNLGTDISREVHATPEVTVAPENLDKYWLGIFKPIQKKWIEDATLKIETAITNAYIYIDASILEYNKEETARVDRVLKEWEAKKKEREHLVPPVSNYGGKHIDEAWAEAFANYVTGEDMTRDQIDSFKSVLKTAADRVAMRYRSAKTFDDGLVEGLRKDFLTLMKNVPRVKDYKTGAQLREAFIVYKRNFSTFFFDQFLNVYKEEGDHRFEGLRKPAWDLYIELRLPLEYSDEYYSEAARFSNYEREVGAWEARLRTKAQKFWKAAKEALSYQTSPVEVKVPDRNRLVMEGFQIEVVDYDPNEQWQSEALPKLKEALRRYRRNAAKTVPWMLKHQLPLEVSFGAKLDEGGRYRGEDIFISLLSVMTGNPDNAVKTLAHEMGHHMFKLLSGSAKEFWNTAIRQDYGPLPLLDVLSVWPTSMRWSSDFVEMMAEKDPVLALQVDVISWGHGERSEWNERDDFQSAYDSGTPTVTVSRSPVTGYAGKNPEEAFCEALGLLVAYGPRAVLPLVRHWLEIVIPGEVKLASRVLERFRLLASA